MGNITENTKIDFGEILKNVTDEYCKNLHHIDEQGNDPVYEAMRRACELTLHVAAKSATLTSTFGLAAQTSVKEESILQVMNNIIIPNEEGV